MLAEITIAFLDCPIPIVLAIGSTIVARDNLELSVLAFYNCIMEQCPCCERRPLLHKLYNAADKISERGSSATFRPAWLFWKAGRAVLE